MTDIKKWPASKKGKNLLPHPPLPKGAWESGGPAAWRGTLTGNCRHRKTDVYRMKDHQANLPVSLAHCLKKWLLWLAVPHSMISRIWKGKESDFHKEDAVVGRRHPRYLWLWYWGSEVWFAFESRTTFEGFASKIWEIEASKGSQWVQWSESGVEIMQRIVLKWESMEVQQHAPKISLRDKLKIDSMQDEYYGESLAYSHTANWCKCSGISEY